MNGPELFTMAEKLTLEALAEDYPTVGSKVTSAMVRADRKIEAAKVLARLARVALAYDALPDHIRHDDAWSDATA